jgi:hypothetical protein
MKATIQQKKICDLIIAQINFWKESNDINSSTHYCDNSESIISSEFLNGEDQEDLINFLDNLLNFVKENK